MPKLRSHVRERVLSDGFVITDRRTPKSIHIVNEIKGFQFMRKGGKNGA